MSADYALLTPSCRAPSGLAEEDHQDSNLLDDVFRAIRPTDDEGDALGSSSCEPSSPLSPVASGSRLNEDFNEKLGVFARSLAGSCSGSVTKASPGFTDLDSVVRERARQKAASTSAAASVTRSPGDTSARVGQSDEDQINDETVQQSIFSNAHITEVFDPSFKFCFEVPTATVVHVPPTRLNITRLVFCRNYQPGNPTSCAMGDGCKFVHADVDFRVLEAHSIHVKYSWRSEHVCIYARLPAGEVLHVSSPNSRPPVEDIPSERVLVTRGSLRRKEEGVQLSHCAHYHFNRMCNRGERCNFIHAVHVDPNVPGDFKRAPCCKAGSGSSVGAPKAAAPPTAGDASEGTLLVKATELTQKKSVPNPLSPPWTPSGAASQSVMPQQPGYLSYSGSHASAQVTGSPAMMQAGIQQYGMVVFVPCDAAIPPTVVSPGILSPSAIGGPPALSMLPAATLDLMHAAFPGLASRWSIPGGDPAASAVAALAGGGAGANHYHHQPHHPPEGASWVTFGNAQGFNVTAGGAPTAGVASYPHHGMLPMDAPNARRPATRGLRNSMR